MRAEPLIDGPRAPIEGTVDKELERTILALRDELDAEGQAAFASDLRLALSLPPERRDEALARVVRSWQSRRELQAAPDSLPWLR